MARVRDMQGVPAHIEYLRSDGKRRHPAHCTYAFGKGQGRICDCPECPIFREACRSAAKCDYYKDTRG